MVCDLREIDKDRGGGSRGGDKDLKGDQNRSAKERDFSRGTQGAEQEHEGN